MAPITNARMPRRWTRMRKRLFEYVGSRLVHVTSLGQSWLIGWLAAVMSAVCLQEIQACRASMHQAESRSLRAGSADSKAPRCTSAFLGRVPGVSINQPKGMSSSEDLTADDTDYTCKMSRASPRRARRRKLSERKSVSFLGADVQ